MELGRGRISPGEALATIQYVAPAAQISSALYRDLVGHWQPAARRG